MIFTWDPSVAQYRDPQGLFVPRIQIRRALDRLVKGVGKDMQEMARSLTQGRISVSDFEVGMRSAVKSIHLNSAAAARGGYGQMTQSDYGRVGAAIRFQYEHLDNFVTELYAGEVKLDSKGFLSRVQQYFNSARVTFYLFDDLSAEEAGLEEERNRLHPAEHCDTCVDMSALGWVKRGTLIPIGQRECKWNDRCTIERR